MRRRLLPVVVIVIGALASVALLLAGTGALLPRDYRVERSITINAPAPAVHRWVNDLRHWPRWAQWDRTALSPRNELADPSSGSGATLTWYGKGPSGGDDPTGTVRIVRSDAERGVWFETRVRGEEPASAELLYAAGAGVTQVTWIDRGRLPRVIGGLFLDDFQQRLGRHMAQGLTRLKHLVERESPEAAESKPPASVPAQIDAE